MNQSLGDLVSEKNAKEVAQITWENSLKVMEKKITLTFEETDKGKTFLSVKSPLVVNEKVEGVIGLSVDITDRKEKEELEIKLKLQEELYRIARDVSHDIVSPLTALGAFQYLVTNKLTDKENEILDSLKRSITDIAGKMMEKYKEIKDMDYTKAVSAAKKHKEKEEEKIDLNLS